MDLPAEEKLAEIVLVPRRDGLPWPKELTIKVACDAWHWTTVLHTRIENPPEVGKPVRVTEILDALAQVMAAEIRGT